MPWCKAKLWCITRQSPNSTVRLIKLNSSTHLQFYFPFFSFCAVSGISSESKNLKVQLGNGGYRSQARSHSMKQSLHTEMSMLSTQQCFTTLIQSFNCPINRNPEILLGAIRPWQHDDIHKQHVIGLLTHFSYRPGQLTIINLCSNALTDRGTDRKIHK